MTGCLTKEKGMLRGSRDQLAQCFHFSAEELRLKCIITGGSETEPGPDVEALSSS